MSKTGVSSKRLLRSGAICFATALGGASQGRASDYDVFPVPLAFVAQGAVVTPAAKLALSSEGTGREFVSAFRAAFPASEPNLKGRNLKRTFVVSLHVPRVSTYLVPKPDGNVDAYVALTGTLSFSDLISGDAIATYTATQYVERGFSSQPNQDAVAELVHAAFGDVLSRLVQQAQTSFKPYAISVTSRRKMGDLYVLDQGMASGLGRGDELVAEDGSGIQIDLAGSRYATALTTLGLPRVGTSFARFTNRPLAELQRPRAMLIPHVTRDQAGEAGSFSSATLNQLFLDALGEKSPFSIVELTPDSSRLRDYLETREAVSGSDLRARVVPNFYIKLTSSPPIFYSEPTNLSYKSEQTILTRVQAEVLTESGRVVFAATGEGRITDQVTAGVGFDRDARAEIAAKNAVTDLAAKLASAAKFETFDLPIRSVNGDSVAVDDSPGVLRVGSSPDALHSLGSVEGIAGPVLAPTWQAHIDEEHGAAAEASLIHPALYSGAPALRSGDVLRVELFSPEGGRNRVRLQGCGSAVSLGSITLAGFNDEAMNAFAGGTGGDTYEPDSMADVASVLNTSGEFRKAIGDQIIHPALCVEPVQRIDVGSENCDPRGVCSTAVNIRLTYRIKRGDDVVYKSGLETTLRSSAYMSSISDKDKNALIQADATKEAVKLLHQIVAQPTFQSSISGL